MSGAPDRAERPSEEDRGWLETLKRQLDVHWPMDLLGNRLTLSAMRNFVAKAGSKSRPALAVDAFAFGASLERTRNATVVSRATWPCHDDLSPACVEDVEDEASQAPEG